MKGYPHLTCFCVGSLLLGVPFVLRTVSPALEVYPSIVFPARATVVDVSHENLEFTNLELWGVGSKGKEEILLDPARFLEPVPAVNLGVLVEREFALNPEAGRSIKFKYVPISAREMGRSKVTPEERQETRDWLRNRLNTAGCEPYLLILRKRNSSINRNTGEVINSAIQNETTLRLD